MGKSKTTKFKKPLKYKCMDSLNTIFSIDEIPSMFEETNNYES